MEHIIQQITVEFVKKLMEYYNNNGLHEVGAMAEDILDITKETAKDIFSAFIEDADESLVALKSERRADKISVHERDVPRTLHTSLGNFTYKRTYFDTPEGRVHILDDILGVQAYERVDSYISARMVNVASRMSFARSAHTVTGGAISRQTAWRKAMGCAEVAFLPEKLPYTPERIHIFADEDHVHLQSGRSAILPLVTICSGKERICKGRNALKDRVCLSGYGLKAETLWEYTYEICEAMYDMDKVKEVFIYGDGAKWIESSSLCFPEAIPVLDAHHYRQKMKTLTAGELCSTYSRRLYSAVKRGDKKGFSEAVHEMLVSIVESLPDMKERKKKLLSVSEAGNYILCRFDAVVNMDREGSIGSATEALVSHVFSERFSRSPMGWSKAGLWKMAQVRVFTENGGVVSPNDISAGNLRTEKDRTVPAYVGKYEKLVKQQQQRAFSGNRDWRLFEHERLEWAAPSGTKVALDSLARIRNIS
jgi:hypothetical protein